VAEDKGIRLITLRISPRDEKVWADRDKVEKIAFNLITNALKFTPRGKRVNVTVKRIPIHWSSSWPTRGPGSPGKR
jgi:signal transduction histidine kinase